MGSKASAISNTVFLIVKCNFGYKKVSLSRRRLVKSLNRFCFLSVSANILMYLRGGHKEPIPLIGQVCPLGAPPKLSCFIWTVFLRFYAIFADCGAKIPMKERNNSVNCRS